MKDLIYSYDMGVLGYGPNEGVYKDYGNHHLRVILSTSSCIIVIILIVGALVALKWFHKPDKPPVYLKYSPTSIKLARQHISYSKGR